MTQIKKILIANRGEIARRIIKTANRMNITTVAVYAHDDKNRLFVKDADEAYLLLGSTLKQTYLDMEKIIETALLSGADAIHPGYGFLSENADFAQKCIENNLVWIGPSPGSMRILSDKFVSTNFAKSLNIPVIDTITGNYDELLIASENLQYPVMVKAAAGGGGRGIKIIRSKSELPNMLHIVSKEAQASFNDGRLMISKYLDIVKHIEVQVIADKHGKAIHLFDRDCSIQRRHQKIIEEAPSSISKEIKEAICRDAISLAVNAKYDNAGTVEFLVDNTGHYFFLEMNTRIQVEHPVTEMITGIDIVEQQIRIAEGQKISFKQEDIKVNGHAFEYRICAEDWEYNFLPSTGKISLFKIPASQNLRVESDISEGTQINTNYDSLLAKIVVWGNTRDEARLKSIEILNTCAIHGVKTNINVLEETIKHPLYVNGSYDTLFLESQKDFIKTNIELGKQAVSDIQLIYSTIVTWFYHQKLVSNRNLNVWSNIGFWRQLAILEVMVNNSSHFVEILNHSGNSIHLKYLSNKIDIVVLSNESNKIDFTVHGNRVRLLYSFDPEGGIHLSIDGYSFFTEIKYHNYKKKPIELVENIVTESNLIIVAPLPGRVTKINTIEGDNVRKGDALIVIESMKTENQVLATFNSKVVQVHISEGETIKAKQLLFTLETS
jgi:acetyl/propionyl-CoA carboxylase alpha subunit